MRLFADTEWKDKGNTAFRCGNLPEAMKCYRKALKILPFEVPVLTNMAQVSLKQEAWEDALEWCERALFVDRKCVKGLFRRALAYKAMGRLQLAVQDLTAAVALEPDNAELAKEMRAVTVAQEAREQEELLAAKLQETNAALTEREASSRAATVASSIDPSCTPLINLKRIVERLAPVLLNVMASSTAGASWDAWSPLVAVQADVRGAGGCLQADDCHVLLRSSGVLQSLCGVTTALCDRLREASVSVDAPLPSDSLWPAFQACILTLAATLESNTNRAVIVSARVPTAVAGLLAVNAAVIQDPAPTLSTELESNLAASQLAFVPALLTFVEVLVSVHDVDAASQLNASVGLPQVCVSHILRFVSDPSSHPSLEECASHSASILQALAGSRAPEAGFDKLLAAVTAVGPLSVSALLRCAASLIGRAVVHERYLTGQLMQHVVGALANFAQIESVSGADFICLGAAVVSTCAACLE
jgi:hypothetical protein